MRGKMEHVKTLAVWEQVTGIMKNNIASMVDRDSALTDLEARSRTNIQIPLSQLQCIIMLHVCRGVGGES